MIIWLTHRDIAEQPALGDWWVMCSIFYQKPQKYPQPSLCWQSSLSDKKNARDVSHQAAVQKHITESIPWHDVDKSHHVPEKVGKPVDQRTDSANKLQMFGLGGTFLNEVEDKAGWNEGHGKDDANGHHRIHRCGQTGKEKNESFTAQKLL